MENPEVKRDPLASLRLADFRFFITARLLMTFASQMQGVIIGWQVYQYTKNPFWLGMVELTGAIPFICTSLYAGHIADVIDRKKIMVWSTAMLGVCTALLWAFTLHNSYVLVSYGVAPIFVVMFLLGITRAFMGPSYFAFMSQIVPRTEYSNAATWSSNAWQTGAIGGPAIGGLLYGLVGVTTTYGIDVILIGLTLMCVMVIPSRPLPPRQKKEKLSESLSQGIKFVFSNQEILGALALDLFAVLFGGAVTMLPMFADQILFVGPTGLGILRASPAVGAVIMAAIMAYFPPTRNAGRKLLFCVAGFGVCMILFAVSSNFYLSLFLLALSGAFDSVSVVIRSTIVQLMTPDEMRGRVSAVNNIFISSSNEIGGFESGVTAKLMHLVPSVVFGGIMTIVTVGYTTVKAKKLRALELDGK